MSDLRTKQMCQAVFLHVLAGQSLDAVAAELGLPVFEAQALIFECRDRPGAQSATASKIVEKSGQSGQGAQRKKRTKLSFLSFLAIGREGRAIM